MTAPEKDEAKKAAAQAEEAQEAAEAAAEEAPEEAASEEADVEGAEVSEEFEDLSPEAILEQAQAQAQEWQDKYLRLHAEWDTYRRRMKEQREEEKILATEGLVKGLIPVIDDFERAIDHAQKNGEEGLLGGVSAIRTKLGEVLTQQGVVIIDPAGQAFDAIEAQAVATVDDPSVPDETVAEVYQKGFRMGNKVLRPAMVTVTTGGPKRETLTEEEEQAASENEDE